MQVEGMVKRIIASFKQRIKALDWMEDQTKAAATLKLNKIGLKIGYGPEEKDIYWDMDPMHEDDFVGNLIISAQYDYWADWRHLYSAPNHAAWDTNPQTINAFYDPELNEIVFPAAILQPPFFTPDAEPAQNYGAIGAIIGHEITHAFDDQGSKYDGDGSLVDWWTPKDRARFEERTQKIVEQFNACEMGGNKINGELTQGENIADLGGLITAYYAMPLETRSWSETWSDYWEGSSGEAKKPDINLGRKQAFFKAWANIWKGLIRNEALRDLILTDEHSPGHLRINMPLSNMQEFYDVFFLKPGDKLYREEQDRVQIW